MTTAGLTKAKRTFAARLESAGPNGAWTFLEVPFDAAKVFGSRARIPVCGLLNGAPYRSSISPMGGKHLLMVNKKMQAAAGVRPGEVVKVVMGVDFEPREVEMPADLVRALAKNQTARDIWAGLAYSHRREYAEWIVEARKPETRARRIAKAVELLGAGKKLR